MSRIGKRPVEIPEKVDVKIDGAHIMVKGPLGELSRQVSDEIKIAIEGDEVLVTRPDDSRTARSHQGLTRSLIANMVEGVTEGYTRTLEINGVGYRAERIKDFIRFDLGYSHPIMFELPETVDADVEQTKVTLKSPSKELLGQIAAKVRNLRPPEPYKGKGIKYEEEHIRRKIGKAGGA